MPPKKSLKDLHSLFFFAQRTFLRGLSEEEALACFGNLMTSSALHDALETICLYFLFVGHIKQRWNYLSFFKGSGVHNVGHFNLVLPLAFHVYLCFIL